MQMLVLVAGHVCYWAAVSKFPRTEGIICFNKRIHNSLKSSQGSIKTPTSALQTGQKTPQVRIDTFDMMRICFIAGISNIFCSVIVHIRVPEIPVRAIFFRLWSFINHLLDPPGALVLCHSKSLYLPGFAANHRHQVHIFSRFGIPLSLNKPVKLIKLVYTGEPLFCKSLCQRVFFNQLYAF